ncbi:TIR domain-containing protein [Streptomyces californicus]|uniref:TIR domain-containing protein n=1 Tax=Streptomyces TaxID=1883 RepID=UPI00099C66BA|nr:TIR domain-containing protein [Streptomyces sp. NRRL F-2295]
MVVIRQGGIRSIDWQQKWVEATVKVFLSWSGERSKKTAEALWTWLPDVLQYVSPWLSSLDISAGRRGVREITDELAEANFGIICATPENQSSNWIHFEAGALAKQVNNGFVVPFLIGMRTTDLVSPISQFQAVVGDDRADVQKLLSDINSASGELALPQERLNRSFQRSWPELESKMRGIKGISLGVDPPAAVKRSGADMTEEILLLSRQFDQRLADLERNTLLGGEMPRRPPQEIRRISEEKFIASSFAKIGWEAVRSTWEEDRVMIVVQRSERASQSISHDFVDRLARSLGREVVVLGETERWVIRSNDLP